MLIPTVIHPSRILRGTGYLLLLILLSFSCKKTEEVIIPDNTAPPDETISNLTVENYVNRAYISVLGRKPDDAEFAQGISTLRSNNLAIEDREQFLEQIYSKTEFNQNLFEVARVNLLDNVDTTDIQDQIFVFGLLLNDPQYANIYDFLNAEIDRMQAVLDIPADLANGSLDLPGMHRRMVFNYIYDQINMGTQNYVISCFQSFLFRYPTQAELDAAQLMVNGFTSVFFMSEGESKEDFMDIFFASSDYYEGQVRDVFTRYLYREPDSGEMFTYSEDYKNSGDYQSLLTRILSSDEYIGL